MSTSNRKSSSSGSRPSAPRGGRDGRFAASSRPARPTSSRGQAGSFSSRPSASSGRGSSSARPFARRRGAGVPLVSSARGSQAPRSGSFSPRPSATRSATGRPATGRPSATGRAVSGRPALARPAAGRQQASGRAGLGRTPSRRPRTTAGSVLSGVASRVPSGGAPRKVVLGLVAVGVLAVVALVVVAVLSRMPVFVITGIDATASEHVSADTIAKLAAIEDGTTLLSVDTSAVERNVRQNPWVRGVSVRREFPDTLGITVEERKVGALVVLGSGSSVWALGDDGVWIEPVQVDSSGSDDVTASALAKAQELGCILITNVPSSVDPAQGAQATDDTVRAVLAYQDQLPPDISSKAQVYYAASTGSTSVVLSDGLEISLGQPTDINAKAQALTEILKTYAGQLTYVNVRVPSKPSYRKVSGDAVLAGDAASVVEQKAAEAETAATAAATTGPAASATTADASSSSG